MQVDDELALIWWEYVDKKKQFSIIFIKIIITTHIMINENSFGKINKKIEIKI